MSFVGAPNILNGHETANRDLWAFCGFQNYHVSTVVPPDDVVAILIIAQFNLAIQTKVTALNIPWNTNDKDVQCAKYPEYYIRLHQLKEHIISQT
jgi:hypothetical protein